MTSREQEIGHVGTRHEEHEPHRPDQHQQRRPHPAEDHRAQRFDEGAPGIIGLGVLALEIRHDRGHLLLALRYGRPGCQTPEDEDRMIPAVGIPADLHREPQIHALRTAAIGEAAAVGSLAEDLQGAEVGGRGKHPDDGHRSAPDGHGLADHRFVPGKPFGPQRLADQRDAGPPGPILFRGERRPENGTNPHHRQEFVRHEERREPGGVARADGYRGRGGRDRRQLFIPPGAILHVEVVGNRGRLSERAALAVGLPDHGEAIDGGERRRAEQHPIHHAEDRGIGPDAQGEGTDDREGEAGRPRERTNGLAELRNEIAHGKPGKIGETWGRLGKAGGTHRVDALSRDALEQIEDEPEPGRHRAGAPPRGAPGVAEDQQHFLAEPLAEVRRIEAQQLPGEPAHTVCGRGRTRLARASSTSRTCRAASASRVRRPSGVSR